MPDPKMKFVLEVDDKGKVTFKRFGKNVDSAARKGVKFGKKMKTAGIGVAGLASSSAKAAGKLGLLASGLALVSGAFVAKKVVSEFADFETSLVKVANVSSEGLNKIRKRVLEMEPTLGNATELVRGYYDVISAGVTDPVKALSLLSEASRVAKVQNIEQGEVVKALTKVMAGFGKEMKTAGQAADLLFSIEKAGQTTVQDLVPVIGSLAKASRDLGINQDELGGSLAQVTQFVGNTEEAAVQYQAVLTGLIKPTSAMKKVLKEQGFESAQAAIKSKGLSRTLDLLVKSTGKSSEKMAALFGNVRALKGVQALADDGFRGLNQRIGVMADKTGASAKAWENYEGTLNAVWDTFKNTISNQAILLGEQLAPVIKEVLGLVTDLFQKWRDPIADKFAEIVGTIEINARLLIPTFKEWVGIVKEWVAVARQKWIPSMEIVIGQIRTIIEVASRGAKFVMQFIGEGSSEKPLTEKTIEMTNRVQGFADKVNAMDPQITVFFDSTGAQKAIDQFVNRNMAKLTNLKASLLEISSRPVTGALDREARARNIKSLRGQISTIEQTIAAGTGTSGADLLGSFARGTGSEGLPSTGLFFGHKGEIVNNPEESEAIRSGNDRRPWTTQTEGNGMTLNIEFSPMFLTGDRASMRNAAEMLGDEIQKKIRRLS